MEDENKTGWTTTIVVILSILLIFAAFGKGDYEDEVRKQAMASRCVPMNFGDRTMSYFPEGSSTPVCILYRSGNPPIRKELPRT